jgi:hypothetical protein
MDEEESTVNIKKHADKISMWKWMKMICQQEKLLSFWWSYENWKLINESLNGGRKVIINRRLQNALWGKWNTNISWWCEDVVVKTIQIWLIRMFAKWLKIFGKSTLKDKRDRSMGSREVREEKAWKLMYFYDMQENVINCEDSWSL